MNWFALIFQSPVFDWCKIVKEGIWWKLLFHDFFTESIGHITDTFGKDKGVKMLAPLFGSKGSEKVLIFLIARGEGYASEIAQFFDMDISTIQNQLDKFELGGILSSTTRGRTRLYVFNPRYPFQKRIETITG